MSSEFPVSVPSAPKPRPKRVRGPNLGLDVDSAATPWRSLTWQEKLRRVWFSLGTGVGVSVALHTVILIALGLWVYQLPRKEAVDTYITDWFDSSHMPTTTKNRRKPVGLPVNIDTVPAAPGQGSAKKAPTEIAPAVGSGPGVKPVNVGQGAFGNRGVGLAGVGGGSGAGGGGTGLEALGGSDGSQRAVKAGLAWLARQQQPSGNWELHRGYPDAAPRYMRTDTGATALALLCFLGAGYTAEKGDYAPVIKKGLRWIISQQDPDTGDLHDQRQEEGRAPAFYAHSMATMALCESIVLTGDPSLREPAERAVQYLLFAQHPDYGGWKYRPINKTMVGDMSVTGWALMALHTARMAGIEVSTTDFQRASAFIDSVQEHGGSRYKYEPTDPAETFSAALTAEGLLCRQWFGWARDYPPMQDGIRYLLAPENRPEWSPGKRNLYGWYYTAQMLHNVGGEPWQSWFPPVRDLIVKHQISGGSSRGDQDVRGSWSPNQPEGMPREYADRGGRLYVTAFAILILETPYRHRPLYDEGDR
ncbi:MAG TPA: prenyltransferase/squalene oxidase repeat-containing protein [Planctomycetaceae bacterium]|nr:prenyltransferase/squalene oxidase repeat-containing protein [Planctomycetaceae bacterium]